MPTVQSEPQLKNKRPRKGTVPDSAWQTADARTGWKISISTRSGYRRELRFDSELLDADANGPRESAVVPVLFARPQ